MIAFGFLAGFSIVASLFAPDDAVVKEDPSALLAANLLLMRLSGICWFVCGIALLARKDWGRKLTIATICASVVTVILEELGILSFEFSVFGRPDAATSASLWYVLSSGLMTLLLITMVVWVAWRIVRYLRKPEVREYFRASNPQ